MRTKLIAVVGSGKTLEKQEAALAEELGAALVRDGFGVLCGGLGGIMEAACRGAITERGKARHPPVIGLLPGYEANAGNDYLDIALPTGLGHARNALVAAGADAMICIGGAMGALSEVALARKIGRPVICFPDSGGTAGLVSKAVPTIHGVASVEEAVVAVKELLA